MEGLQTRASLGPWSEGWMGNPQLDVSQKGVTAHQDQRWDTELTYSGLIHDRLFSPALYLFDWTTIMQQGRQVLFRKRGIIAGEMPLSVHSTARAHSTASCQALIPSARKAALIPAHTQITASATDHSILGDLHKMLTGFRGRDKHFSFCQCKQLTRSCFGCVELRRRVKQDSAPKTYLNWLWEVGMYMPVGLAIKNVICFHSLGTTSLLSTILPWAAKPDHPQVRAHSRAGASPSRPAAEEVAIYFKILHFTREIPVC